MPGALTLLDGGMGRELARRGAPFRQPEWSALALMEAPEHVQAVHEDFIGAGARVITTDSYALVPFHLGEDVFAAQARTLADRAGRLARAAADDAGSAGVRVAGSLPPLFGSYRPDLFDAERAPEVLAPLVAGLSGHVDLWLAETQGSLAEVRAVKAGLPDDGLDELREDLGPAGYLSWAERWREQGAAIIGGCCGIGPEHLEVLRERLS